MQKQRTSDRRWCKTKHAGIYTKGSNGGPPYYVRWKQPLPGGERKPRARSCSTMQEALEFQGTIRAPGTVARAPAPKQLLADYAPKWLDGYQGRTRRGRPGELTIEAYGSALDLDIIPRFGHYKLGEIEPPDIRAFVVELQRRGLARGSVKKIIAPLNAMLETAVEDGALRTNPARGVRIAGRQDEAPKRRRGFTLEELQRFLGETPESWRPFFVFLAHTGLRISEACGLRWNDVVFGDRPHVRVSSQLCRGKRRSVKSENGLRVVPLSSEVARALWVRSREQESNAPVFPSPRGKPLRAENVRSRVFRPAAERAGVYVRGVGFHDLRHVAASLVWHQFHDAQEVQGWLGHADASFTQRTYVHPLQEGPPRADFLDGLVSMDGTVHQEVHHRSTSDPERPGTAGAVTPLRSATQSESANAPERAVAAGENS